MKEGRSKYGDEEQKEIDVCEISAMMHQYFCASLRPLRPLRHVLRQSQSCQTRRASEAVPMILTGQKRSAAYLESRKEPGSQVYVSKGINLLEIHKLCLTSR